MVGYDISFRVKLQYTLFGNLGLWSSNMFLLKQKLPVELADISSIQITQVDLGEASEHEVFEELAAEAARPHRQDPAPGHGLRPRDGALAGRPPAAAEAEAGRSILKA